jgi:chemotaxis protein MotB
MSRTENPEMDIRADLSHSPFRDTTKAGNSIAFLQKPLEDDFLFETGMHRSVHWSVPWSDLMMTMFILFAVMFVYQSLSSREEPVPAPSISEIYQESKRRLGTKGMDAFATVELTKDKAVRILLTSDLLFDTGRAELKSEAKAVLEKVAAIIHETPYMVNLVGHTDDVPIHTEQFPTNWELSTARACAVARFLIEEMQLPASRFYISGHAHNQPLRPNDSEESRALNRRVEIIITKERPSVQARQGLLVGTAG